MGGSISMLQRNKRNNFLSVDFVMFMFGGCDQRSVASTRMRTFTRAESWKDIYFYYTTFARCLQYFLWFSIENLNLNQFILHSLPASLGWQTKLERIQPSKAIYRIFPPVQTQTPTINHLFLQSLLLG